MNTIQNIIDLFDIQDNVDPLNDLMVGSVGEAVNAASGNGVNQAVVDDIFNALKSKEKGLHDLIKKEFNAIQKFGEITGSLSLEDDELNELLTSLFKLQLSTLLTFIQNASLNENYQKFIEVLELKFKALVDINI